jgi:hypothetical protein
VTYLLRVPTVALYATLLILISFPLNLVAMGSLATLLKHVYQCRPYCFQWLNAFDVTVRFLGEYTLRRSTQTLLLPSRASRDVLHSLLGWPAYKPLSVDCY